MVERAEPLGQRPLSFKQLVEKLTLIGVRYCPAVYKDGSGFFAGKESGYFPFHSGPIVSVVAHKDTDLMPVPFILNILHRLALKDEDVTAFWAAQDHGDIESIAPDTRSQ